MTQASTIGDEQSLDSAIVVVPRHPLKGDGLEDLTHERSHRRNAKASLQHRAGLKDHVVAGEHGEALSLGPAPEEKGVRVLGVILVEQRDEKR
jgi:3-deoxy-D-manno-octulosonic-acid transferase